MRRAIALAALVSMAPLAPLSLASGAARAEGLTDMTEAERVAFNEAVRAYLIANPEVIVEAMTELQNREMAASAEQDRQRLAENRDAIFASDKDWSGGNPEGDVVLVEFMDYRCGYCHKAYSEVEELVKSDGNIRFVLKEFPILGEQSLLASQFAIAILQLKGNDAYKAAHDALFSFRGEITAESLKDLAKRLGHDGEEILARMESDEVRAVIEANYQLASQFDISGTPTFILNDTLVQGYVPLTAMRERVAAVRADG